MEFQILYKLNNRAFPVMGAGFPCIRLNFGFIRGLATNLRHLRVLALVLDG